MHHRPRDPRLRRFLHLAAIAFALAGDPPAALAEDGETDAPAESYRHALPLPAVGSRSAAPARVRVLDAAGRPAVQLVLDGAATVGPLRRGAYTVLVNAHGLTEVHRVRIDGGTPPFLEFGDVA